jgi:predicted O-linked N-acetylglucosamine transferase (SPINDLY family)
MEAATASFEAGNFEEAVRELRGWLAHSPEDSRAQSLLAGALSESGQHDEACELADRALAAHSREPQQACAAAEIHRRAGKFRRALDLAILACQLEPGNEANWLVRARILEQQGNNPDAWHAYGRAVALAPDDRNLHSSMLFLINRSALFSPRRTLTEHRRWAERHADPLTASAKEHLNSIDTDRPLRIGYVSADFRNHVLAFFIEPVIASHDRTRFEVVCYSSSTQADDFTHRLRSRAAIWRDIALMNDDDAAALIRDDAIDILVDLSGHTRGNRLPVFARKPAPLQLTWLGYLGTTGMKAMDYFIGDPRADPSGEAEAEFSEKILRLPVTNWCFRQPPEAPVIGTLPALRNGFVTFGSFSNFLRLDNDTLESWAQILKALPDARLRVVGAPEDESLERLTRVMDAVGIAAGRLDFIRKVSYVRYFELLAETDIALGAYPYNGATTICEALWMGVPVVSRSGDRHASRASRSILGAIGLEHLVAREPGSYVEIAVGLAKDTGILSTLRAGLRQRMLASHLMDARAFTSALEDAYRGIWKDWCGNRGARP